MIDANNTPNTALAAGGAAVASVEPSYAYHYDGPIVTIEDVTFSYSKGPTIIKGFSAQVQVIEREGAVAGQTISIVGPSGCGKSTLFQLLAGLRKPGSGRVLIGKDQHPAERGEMGVVAQNYPLFRDMRVIDNLRLAAKLGGLTKVQAEERIAALIKTFGIEGILQSWPYKCSGGERQRAAIVRQLLCSSHFLLMDEPFSGLDLVKKQNTIDAIISQSQQDTLNTTMIITHDVPSAVCVGDRILLIGRDHDAQGNIISGTRVQEDINLIDEGLAWRPDIRKLPAYRKMVDRLEERVLTL